MALFAIVIIIIIIFIIKPANLQFCQSKLVFFKSVSPQIKHLIRQIVLGFSPKSIILVFNF